MKAAIPAAQPKRQLLAQSSQSSCPYGPGSSSPEAVVRQIEQAKGVETPPPRRAACFEAAMRRLDCRHVRTFTSSPARRRRAPRVGSTDVP